MGWMPNARPSPANGVLATDHLPSAVSPVSVSPSEGTCTGAGSVVTCDLGTLAKGAKATITIKVMPRAVGRITNAASVRANEADPNDDNNPATTHTLVVLKMARVSFWGRGFGLWT
jgi:Domain of unknown function DUF11